MYHVEFVEFLGEIMNGTGTNGKSFIFKIVDPTNGSNFEAALFVHPTAAPFVTLDFDNTSDEQSSVLAEILNNFKLEELLAYEN